MARIAPIISSMRAAGRDHGIEKRLVMWAWIWLPSPSMNRPPDRACRSQATCASTIGLRAKPTAMAVINSMRSVWGAARARGRNGSWLVSADSRPL